MEVAEVGAPERKKVRRSSLRNPQVNFLFLRVLWFVTLPCPCVEFLTQPMYPMLQRTLSSLNAHKCMNHGTHCLVH